MLNTTKTPRTSTEYSNSAIELPLSTTQSLKLNSNSQLEIIFYLSNLLIVVNKTLNKRVKALCFTPINSQSYNLHGAQKWLKNAPYTPFFIHIYYFEFLIKEFFYMINYFDCWAINNCSSQGKRQLVELYIKEKQPHITPAALSTLTNIFFYYSTKDEFVTCIKKLEILASYKSRKIKEILQELETLDFIKKSRNCYFTSEDSLVLKLINIDPLSIFLREQPIQFLATYVKTETLHARGLVFKAALFKDVHDLENLITLKTDRISYDDETSDFLKKLNAGDVICYTPSINKPTIGGIKYPLNLMIFKKKSND